MQLTETTESGSGCRRKMKNGNYLSTYIRKINICGSAFCIYCNKPLVYSNIGKQDLLN